MGVQAVPTNGNFPQTLKACPVVGVGEMSVGGACSVGQLWWLHVLHGHAVVLQLQHTWLH